jgi:polysaccharide biosynthesis protein VpsM
MLQTKKIPIFYQYALLLSVSFLLFSSFLFAGGKMTIKPHIGFSWQMDSNYHKSETDEKEVYTYSINPGLELGYETDKTTVSLDYSIDVLMYDDVDDIPAGSIKAEDHDSTAQEGIFSLQSQVSDRVLVGVDDVYLKTRDPANADANNNAVDRFEYIMNTFSPMLFYKFDDKFGLGLKYTNLDTNYDKDEEGESSKENRGTIDFYYYLNPQTSFDLNYQIWARDYDKSTSDYDSNQVMLNVNHQFNYFTVSAGAGYHSRDFDKNTHKDIDCPSWQVSILGQNPPEAVEIPKSSMFVSVTQNFNDSGSGETYYTATRLDARLTHLFYEKINFTLAGYFQNSDYETGSRNDDTWEVYAALDWLIHDYVSLGVEAGRQERNSSQMGKDYENDYFMLNLKFNFDFASK